MLSIIKSVILIDDHAVLRNGIKNWIENNSDFRVKFEAETYSECAEILKKLEQEVHGAGGSTADMGEKYIAVVDISFKPESDAIHHEETTGFKIIKQFTELGVPCIAFSSHDSGGFIEHAMSPAVGAKGFVSKVADEKVLLDALNVVANGGTYIQAELVKGLLEVRDITQTFSKREKIIAEAIKDVL